MENIILKCVTVNDIEKLQIIGRKTFTETFSDSNSEENMQEYLKNSFSEEKLTDELQNSNSEFYFAMQAEEVIGYLKINFGAAQTELQDSKALEIERIYVSKEFHGKNIGQFLYNHAITIAKKLGCTYVWLGVWEENHRAINFYQKNGFVAFDRHVFILGEDKQTDIMMRLRLDKL